MSEKDALLGNVYSGQSAETNKCSGPERIALKGVAALDIT
jgi:hypothetical protein